MSSPVDDEVQPTYVPIHHHHQNSSSEDGTVIGDGSTRDECGQRPSQPSIRVDTVHESLEPLDELKSPSRNREQSNRLDDDLRLLQIEQQISRNEAEGKPSLEKSQTRSVQRERSRRDDAIDEFDVATNPLHERTQMYKPPDNPTTRVGQFFKRVHNSNVFVRWVTYVTPVTLIILVPLLIGSLVDPAEDAAVGGVKLQWFCIWLEIVWLTLWLGRLIAKCLPFPVGLIASLFTNNSKKWRDMAKQLELAATLFFWWLGIEISFLPTMINHHIHGVPVGHVQSWENTMNKVLVSFFVLATLNFIEKIIIQLIAISFHLRTYQERIEVNKFQIGSLTKLYTYSRHKLEVEDSDFEEHPEGGSGARTPGQVLEKAQKHTKVAFNKFGDVAGKIAGDFTGKKIVKSDHPSQVVLTLLHTTSGSQILARRLYRTFHTEETETVQPESLNAAFDNLEECEAAFSMFDKDMNGDISMEELEAVCVEIGRERKAITASLKDLDSVVSKLDDCFLFIVVVVSVLVLISLLSTAAAGVLTSAGSVVLALSWLFQATAQEFLQSVIFVFVKHPFDVGDRVTVYGLTGALLTGDDYFVKEISLLYTEFKKMEGQVVQAPNSYLNTLFILNHRRSGGLAEAVPVVFKFGTTLEQIDGLRSKLLEFVKAEKREYKPNILTELREIFEAHQITLNIVFFFKSSWQNEALRLQRRNKFICALMVAMQEMGIEGPRMRYPGQKESFPVYLQNVPAALSASGNHGGHPDNPSGISRERNNSFVPFEGEQTPPRAAEDGGHSRTRSQSSARRRGESIAEVGRRLDFSLGTSEISSGDPTGDVFSDRDENLRNRIPINISSPRTSMHRATVSSGTRQSNDIARTTSRSETFAAGVIHRSRTDGPRNSASLHRNRFFGRRSHDVDMEQGMAGIPESPPNGNIGSQPLDPRSGTISPTAMRIESNDSGQSPLETGTSSVFQTSTTSSLPQRTPPATTQPPTSIHGVEMTQF